MHAAQRTLRRVADLVMAMGVSLDGYYEDASGSFDFTEPDPEVHRLASDQAREMSAFVFGRRLYETMEPYWPDAAERDDLPDFEAEFARAYVRTPRVVVSDTLESVGEGVRLVRRADARAEIERLKATADGPVEVGGPTLAASVIDLVDEFRMWVNPVAVGGGKPYFPAQRLDLRLHESRTFESGTLFLRYRRR